MGVYTHFGHRASVYQLASSAHGQFLCEECGKMIEGPDELFNGLARCAMRMIDFSIKPLPRRHHGMVRRVYV